MTSFWHRRLNIKGYHIALQFGRIYGHSYLASRLMAEDSHSVLVVSMSDPQTTEPPPLKLHWGQRSVTRCQADEDDCDWQGCPQLRDNEPEATGRHCPLDRQVDR